MSIFEIQKFYQNTSRTPTSTHCSNIFWHLMNDFNFDLGLSSAVQNIFLRTFMLFSSSSSALEILLHVYIYFNVLKKIPCLSSFSFHFIELPTFFLRILGSFLPARVGMHQFCFGQCQICYFLPLLNFISLEVICFSSKNSFLFNMALFRGNQLLSY